MSGIDPDLQAIVDSTFTSLDDLFAAGEAVAVLRESVGWAQLQRALGAELRAEEQRLSRGRKPLDQAEYAIAHGRMGGLRVGLDLADAIVERANEVRQQQAARHENDSADAESER